MDVALEKADYKNVLEKIGTPSPYTCPECHGVLLSIREGDMVRFRCHTGHAFSADGLLASISQSIEDSLWNSVRGIQECEMLLNQLGDYFAGLNKPPVAARYFTKAGDAVRLAVLLRKAIGAHEQLNMERIQEESDKRELWEEYE